MPATSGSSLKVMIEEARRQSDDTRPEMLRLLARLYLAGDSHSEAEQARFSTLAMRLIDAVGPNIAAPVVRTLAPREDLPRELARYLVRGPLSLAGPILRLSPVLDEAALLAIADEGGRDHLAALSARRDVPPALARKLAEMRHEKSEPGTGEGEDPSTAPSFVTEDAELVVIAEPAPIPEPVAPPVSAEVAAEAVSEPAEAPVNAPLPAGEARMGIRADYLAASPEDRALIVSRLVTLPPLPLAERVGAPRAGFTDALLDAAKGTGGAAVAALLVEALGVTPDNAARIVADDSGQSFAVAARALGLSFAVLSRVMFRLHPVTGRSSSDMSRLADLFDALPIASAQHLVASWRAGPRKPPARSGEEAPSMRDYAVARPSLQAVGPKVEKADRAPA